jgi:teichuronic acid biosynthesis glycosyltransferase TuaC
MKVLFVCSGRKPSSISPIIRNQGESLRRCGIEIYYFSIKGRGLIGYLRSIFPLRNEIRKIKPEIIHAHYSLCCIVATFASRKPIVASLMGSDVMSNWLMILILRFLSKYFWKATIVKSKSMKEQINLNHTHIIPNGVDLSFFKPLDQLECKKKVSFDTSKKQILFMADPSRYEKNYELALAAYQTLQENFDDTIELKVVHGVEHQQVLYYINAADVVLLTSRWEGSPNVIKESMACNVSIVSTRVGDVEDMISTTKGCFLAESTSQDISDKLEFALTFNGRTDGRGNILHLDSKLIAGNIISIYEKVSA